MSKKLRELYHYLILSLFLTIDVFVGYYLSTLIPFMDWISGNLFFKIVGWTGLFLLYFVITLIFFIPSDKFLHYIFKL